MEDKTLITITGLICISVLETIALLKEIDGVLFGLVVSVIAGAIGVKIGRVLPYGKRSRRTYS